MTKDYFSEHWTLSEWLVGSDRRADVVFEDGSKRQRLDLLRQLAGVPSVQSTSFPLNDIINDSPSFRTYRESAGERPYALRLSPLTPGHPVHRQRGRTVPELMRWMRGLELPVAQHEGVFEPHVDSVEAAIFVVSHDSVWGEAHRGPLLALNRGTAGLGTHRFATRGGEIVFESGESEIGDLIRTALSAISVPDAGLRETLKVEVRSQFQNSLIMGYFEVIRDERGDVYFVDYNRLLTFEGGEPHVSSAVPDKRAIQGQIGCRGRGTGPVYHVDDSTDLSSFPEGAVMVSLATRPDYIRAMAIASAVVTEVGGILSHAAIACRELGTPCVVGAEGAMAFFPSGVLVEVDADSGSVYLLAN